jgi:glycerol-3-phosphate acyltransferase PlsY
MARSQLALLFTVVAFMSGAIPFALWLTRVIARSDVRAVGDGNPGAGNAFKAGGWRAGVPALVLDVGKAAVPVGVARLTLGLSGWALVPIAFAPVVGHAFSPFLKFRGGKAIAATFGSWAGLTGYVGPLALALSMGVFYALQTVNSWTVLGGMLLFGLILFVAGAPLALLAVWLLNLALLAYTQRGELRMTSSPRSWLQPRSRRAG